MDELTDNTATQLWEMDKQEREAIRTRLAEESGASRARDSERLKLIDIHSALSEKYPLPWKYASLVERYGEDGAEIAYIEIAVNGRFFDPRHEQRGYRPPLEALKALQSFSYINDQHGIAIKG
jgi:hypothetical protein